MLPRRLKIAIRQTLTDPAAFTLMEMVVAAFLMAVIMSMLTPATFQILALQRNWRDDMVATKELRNGGAWFARDALNTMTSTLTDLEPATSTVTLYWRSVLGGSQEVTYSLTGTKPYKLQREINGVSHPVAKHVESVSFKRAGKVITFSLEVNASEDKTITTTLNTFMRNMK